MYWADNVRETSVTEGTGDLTLAGAVATYQTWLSGVGNSRLAPYFIRGRTGSQWEVGLGTLSGGTTLQRTNPINGSAGARTLVDFASGIKDVYNTAPAFAVSGSSKLVEPCRVATVGNITINSILTPGTTHNGVSLAADDRVFVNEQTDKSQNGVWIVAATPRRANDCYAGAKMAGVIVAVQSGTTYPGTVWHCTNAIGSDVAGTANLVFAKFGGDTSGLVAGPTPTTDNALALWDGTTGRLLKNSDIIAHPVTDLSSNATFKLQFKAWYDTFKTVTYASTSIFDLDAANTFKLTLAGNPTLEFDRHTVGELIWILLTQDATGGRTVTWPSDIAWDCNLAPVLDPTPAGTDLVCLRCIGTNGYGFGIWQECYRKTSAPRKGITTLTDGATITMDPRVSPKMQVTLTASGHTLALAGSKCYVGQALKLDVIQDATGGRTLNWFNTINWAGGSAPTLSTAPNLVDSFGFLCTDYTTPKFQGFVLGQGLSQ